MKKENILRKNWDFQKVLNRRQQHVSKFLILYYIPHNKFQIGISIPKKFAIAVQRNFLRRQIRAIFNEINYTNVKYKVVLIIRKDFINLNFEDKKHIIKQMIERLK
ncbi:MAG: ribonuclease P protein component [Metamycoplasmataceae bacterium]